jgi:triacylglycerol lipase
MGFSRIGLGPLTFASYFGGIPGLLQAAGNRVLVPQVPSMAGVAKRAEQLAAQIDTAFPGEPVHLICHSMGGLDARALMADSAWQKRILSVTTIGTPHLGSSLADNANARAGRILRWLDSIGVDHQGIEDLTCDAALAFNEAHPAPPDTPCFSVAGNPGPEQVSWPLQRLQHVLGALDGPNDGLVTIASANAFGTPLDPWPVDHLHQVNGVTEVPTNATCNKVAGLYFDLVNQLSRLGFGEPEGSREISQGVLPNCSAICRLHPDHAARRWFWFGGGAVKQNGHSHVAQHVGSGAAAVEKPVDREQNGQKLVGLETHGGKDQRQGDEAA